MAFQAVVKAYYKNLPYFYFMSCNREFTGSFWAEHEYNYNVDWSFGSNN